MLRIEGAVSLTPDQATRVQRLRARSHVVDLHLARVDAPAAEAIAFAARVTIPLDSVLSAGFTRSAATVHPDGRTSWSGQGVSPGAAIQLVSGPVGMYASARVGEQTYRVEPLGGGVHAVTRVDYQRLPREESNSTGVLDIDSIGRIDSTTLRGGRTASTDLHLEAVGSAVRSPQTYLRLSPSVASLSQGDTTTVVVAYTSAVTAAVLDPLSFIQLAVDETNTGYSNSGIPLFVQLVHAGKVDYNEAGKTLEQHLVAFRATSDGVMDAVHGWRDQYLGDVAVLLVDYGDACGLASQILATHTTAFAVVRQDCATGSFSFGHEIGHLQGARHQLAYDPATSPFAYGHGFVAPGNAFRTIMAVASPAPRVNHWSNNDDTNPIRGSTQSEDNARVLSETRSTVAAFRRHISVTIDGPTSVRSFEFCTWNAVIGGNVPAASYHWSGVASGSGPSLTDVVSTTGVLTIIVYDAYGRGNVHELPVAVDDNGPSCGGSP